VVPANANELMGEYKSKMLAARGNKTLGKEIREKYKKLGVPVETVVFSV
jgi:hypothetical protein